MKDIIEHLAELPPTWQLTPLGKQYSETEKINPKAPYLLNWQNTDCDRDSIVSELKSAKAVGIGLRLGKPSGYIVAIDFDGQSAIDYWTSHFGEVPPTVTWTSGKEGRYQALFQVPEAYWDKVKTKKIPTGKSEQLEFRYTGNQSVLPPSPHPETSGYVWKNSPIDTPVADLPQEVIDYWLKLIEPKRQLQVTTPKPKPRQVEESNYIPPIPLENCLAKSNREVLDGVGKGSRNDDGFKLACDLIGTAEYLQSLGVDFDGDPYQMFDRFALGCTPPLSAKESESICRSAQQSNPTPACQGDGIKNILDAWKNKHTISHQRTSALKPAPTNPVVEIEEIDNGKPHFTTSWEQGLEWESWQKDKETGEYQKTRTRVGKHIEAIAYCQNPDGSGTAIQIEFRTQRNKAARVMVLRSTLTGDGNEAIKFLADRGYHYIRKQKSLLLDYLFGLGTEVDRVYTISEKTGWVNGSFLLPGKTYGDENLRFREPELINNPLETIGTLDAWKSEVAAKCEGNGRLIFSLGCSFAPPLLEPAQIESGGFHLTGTTSIGKTTALKVMSSVAGLKNIPSWRTTSNALEGKATEFNHLGMPIDEINQALPSEVGQAAYLLGNGKGKERMLKSLANAKPKSWELLFLSTGEVSMDDYLRQAKMPVKGGMEARMPSIPADAGKGYGVFENLHGYQSSEKFVAALEKAIRLHQGTALDAYLTQLVEVRKSEDFDRKLREKVYSIAQALSQPYSDNAIGRVAVRFALVQVGLELAHSYNLLPFPIEQCSWAVSQMFAAWVNARGGDGSIEIKEACNRIEHLFVSNQHSDRICVLDNCAKRDEPEHIIRNLLGYKMHDALTDEIEYCIPVPVFNKELADGVDRATLIKELQHRKWMKLSLEKDRNTVKRTIDGKRVSVFAFRPFWIDLENDEKSRDARDTRDTDNESSSQSHYLQSPDLSRDENTNGTHGTATAPQIDLLSRCPVAENSTGQQRENLETAHSNGFVPTVSCVPCVPLENHDSQNAPKKLAVKVNDRVEYVGNLEKYKGMQGVVDAVVAEKVEVKWDNGVVIGLVQFKEVVVVEVV